MTEPKKFVRPEYTDEWIDEAIYECLLKRPTLSTKSTVRFALWNSMCKGTEFEWRHQNHGARERRWKEEVIFESAFEQKWSRSTIRLRKAGKIFYEPGTGGETGWGAGSMEDVLERKAEANRAQQRSSNIREDFHKYKVMVENTLKRVVLWRPDEPITMADGSEMAWQQVILEASHLHHHLWQMTQDEWEEIYEEIYDADVSVLELDPQVRKDAYGYRHPVEQYGIIELPRPRELLEIHRKGTAIVQKHRAKK